MISYRSENQTATVDVVPSSGGPAHDAIRVRAYEIFLARGNQPGSAWDDWIQAETELKTSTDRVDE